MHRHTSLSHDTQKCHTHTHTHTDTLMYGYTHHHTHHTCTHEGEVQGVSLFEDY